MHDPTTATGEDSLKSPLLHSLPGIIHAFGTRLQPIGSTFASSWTETTRPIWKQVHGAASVEVTHTRQSCGEVDALWTRSQKTPIAVVTADCVPVLLARKDGTAAAAVHAGWRGTRARIVEKLVAEISGQGQDPSEWVAAIGPCAGRCCYEVSEELYLDFQREFGPSATPTYRHLDLVRVNELQLQKAGISAIDTSVALCTICSRTRDGTLRFNSYRRDGSGGRQFSMISLLS